MFLFCRQGSDVRNEYRTSFIVRVLRNNEHPCHNDHFPVLYRNFLICVYGIFLSLCRTIIYLMTMSAYDLCISFYFPLHPLDRDVFWPSSFISMFFPVLFPSVYTFLIWGLFLSMTCAFLFFPFVSNLWRHFFVTFSFVSMFYPVLSSSVSKMDLIFLPPVSMLDSIYPGLT